MAQFTVDVEKIKPKKLYHPKIAKLVRTQAWTELEKLFEFKFVDGSELGHKPGQFVEVSVFGVGEAPISVSSSPTKKGSFEICVRKVGNLTNALHSLKEGDTVGIRGPFGNGFPVDKLEGKDLLFIGGGIGMVPLRSLINYTLDNRKKFGKVTILYGCKTPAEFLFCEELKIWAEKADYRETVDSPAGMDWKGNCGVITTLIPPLQINPDTTYAVIVGPPVMYKFVIRSLKEKNLPDDHIIMSLERRMKCGVGKCGHCQIGPYYCCKDGPVFLYSQIKNIKEAL